jgi:hypothetical protein
VLRDLYLCKLRQWALTTLGLCLCQDCLFCCNGVDIYFLLVNPCCGFEELINPILLVRLLANQNVLDDLDNAPPDMQLKKPAGVTRPALPRFLRDESRQVAHHQPPNFAKNLILQTLFVANPCHFTFWCS